jgi:DNA-binding MarR family transcriptional regulator
MTNVTRRRPTKRAPLRRQAKTTAKVPTARQNLELQTLKYLRTIFGSARSHDAEIRRLAGIPGAQLWALSEVARTEGGSVNDLSQRMALHQTTASNLVNALVERKLIRRTKDEHDQRIVRLHPTIEGKRLLARAPRPYAGLLPDALSQLDQSRLAQLSSSLAVVVAALKRPAENAAGEPLLGG